MKKIISIALALAMLTALAVPVFAEEELLFAEYAEIGEGTYFDTGYFFSWKPDRVVMDVDVKSRNETWFGTKQEVYLFTADEGMFFYDYCFYYCFLSNSEDGILCGSGKICETDGLGSLPNGRHTVELRRNGDYTKKILGTDIYVDGVKRHEIKDIDIPNISLYLFGTHVYDFAFNSQVDPYEHGVNEYADNAGNITFYSCRIYEGNELIHDYVPAVVKATNQPVIYDAVTGTYRPYSGNAGNVVSYNLSGQGYRDAPASVLSEGSTWIIAAVGVCVVIGAAIIIHKRKQTE